MKNNILNFILVIITSYTYAWCDDSNCRVFKDAEIKSMADSVIKAEIYAAEKIASSNIENGNKLVALRNKDNENEAHNYFRVSYMCTEQVKRLVSAMLSRPQNLEYKPKTIEECLNTTTYALDNTKLCKMIIKLQEEVPTKKK